MDMLWHNFLKNYATIVFHMLDIVGQIWYTWINKVLLDFEIAGEEDAKYEYGYAEADACTYVWRHAE